MSAPAPLVAPPFAAPRGTSAWPLFTRQLRRQAPVALASVAVGVVATLLAARFGRMSRDDLLIVASLVMVECAAWLLGASSVAPDVESGVQAFFARLPVGRARQLALRIGAASAWLALLVVGALALLSLRTPTTESVTGPMLLVITAVVFPASVLASVVAGRGLTAVGLAPVIAGLPGGYGLITAALGAPERLQMDLALVAVPMTLVAALLAYVRAYPVRPSGAPAGLAAVVLAVGAGLVALGVGGGRVHAELTARIDQRVRAIDREHGLWLREESRSVRWPSAAEETRTWLVALDDPLGVVERDRGGLPLEDLGPEGCHSLGASPDGRRFACIGVAGGQRALFLYERSGALVSSRPLQPMGDVSPWNDEVELWADGAACLWRDGEPWFVGATALQSPLREMLHVPAGHVAFGVTGASVVLRRLEDAAIALWEPHAPGPPRVVARGADARSVAVAPDAPIVVALRNGRLEVQGFEAGTAVVVSAEALPLPPQPCSIDVRFAPGGDVVWLGVCTSNEMGEVWTRQAVVVELRAGTWRSVPPEVTPGAWSPSGRRYADSLRLVDLAAEPARPQLHPAVLTALAFDGEEVLQARSLDGRRLRIELPR